MMYWDGYTVLLVISGIAMILVGVAVVGIGVKERLYGIVGGALFLGYGIYVAKKTSGLNVAQ